MPPLIVFPEFRWCSHHWIPISTVSDPRNEASGDGVFDNLFLDELLDPWQLEGQGLQCWVSCLTPLTLPNLLGTFSPFQFNTFQSVGVLEWSWKWMRPLVDLWLEAILLHTVVGKKMVGSLSSGTGEPDASALSFQWAPILRGATAWLSSAHCGAMPCKDAAHGQWPAAWSSHWPRREEGWHLLCGGGGGGMDWGVAEALGTWAGSRLALQIQLLQQCVWWWSLQFQQLLRGLPWVRRWVRGCREAKFPTQWEHGGQWQWHRLEGRRAYVRAGSQQSASQATPPEPRAADVWDPWLSRPTVGTAPRCHGSPHGGEWHANFPISNDYSLHEADVWPANRAGSTSQSLCPWQLRGLGSVWQCTLLKRAEWVACDHGLMNVPMKRSLLWASQCSLPLSFQQTPQLRRHRKLPLHQSLSDMVRRPN